MFAQALRKILMESGVAALTWRHAIMILIACVLIYLAIGKKFEPLLLPISFGMLLANLPLTGLMGAPAGEEAGGLLYYLIPWPPERRE